MLRYIPLLLLVACAPSPIIDIITDDSVSVRYDPALVAPSTAGQAAEAKCRDIGRKPILVNRGKEGGWRTLTYHCIKSED